MRSKASPDLLRRVGASALGQRLILGGSAAGYADMYIAVTRGLTTLQRIAALQEEVR